MKDHFEEGRGYFCNDWNADRDPDLTDAKVAEAKPINEALPTVPAAIVNAVHRRGLTRTKQPIFIRLDIDLMEELRLTVPAWRSCVNGMLRQWADKSVSSLSR